MSTGTVKKENKLKDEFVENGSVEIAKEWCVACRKILGLGLMSESKRMEDSIQSVSKGLNSLESFSGFNPTLAGALESNSAVFKGLAWDLEILRGEYETFEKQKSAAKRGSSDKKNASANMKKKAKEIENKIVEIERLQKSVQAEVDKEKLRQKEVVSNIKALPEGKAILSTRKEFGKKLVILQKLADFYTKSYDLTTGASIDESVTKFSQLNWGEVKTNAVATSHLQSIQGEITRIQDLRTKYVEGKKLFEGAIAEYRIKMATAEGILPPGTMTTYLSNFTEGEQAAREKSWVTAGLHINPTKLTELTNAIGPAQNSFDKWTKLREGDYKKFKSVLEGLQLQEYKLIGLGVFAQAVTVGDQERDYAKAAKLLTSAFETAKSIIAAHDAVLQKQLLLVTYAREVRILGEGVSGDAQKFAAGYTDKIVAVTNEFKQRLITDAFAATKTPETGEIESVYNRLRATLDQYKTEIQSLSDPVVLQNKEQEYKTKRSIRPLLDEISRLVEKAKQESMQYIGARVDPINDSVKAKAWNADIEGARTWLDRRAKDFEFERDTDYQEQIKLHAHHKLALDEIIRVSSELTANSQIEIEKSRTALKSQISSLKKYLAGSRLTTIREETWHAAANVEVEDFESLLKTDNKGAMDKAIVRAGELIDQSKNVMADTAKNIAIPQDSFIAYSVYKDVLSDLITRMKDKDLIATMKKQVEIYGGKSGAVAQLLAELRNDGAGSMEKKKDYWRDKVAAMKGRVEREVLNKYDALVGSRKSCLEKHKLIHSRIMGELSKQIKTQYNITVSGSNLELSGRLIELEGLMLAADSKERYDQLARQLDELNKEVDWALEDVKSGDVAKFIEQNEAGEKIGRKILEEQARYKSQYLIAAEKFKESKEEVKKASERDAEEYKRYVDAAKLAKDSFDKGNFQEAAKRMDLASRMMAALAKNPIGSQVTGRGQENLKQLDARWKNSLTALSDSLNNLSTLIGKSCSEATDELTAPQSDKIKGYFTELIKNKVISEFDRGAFERGLLILQSPPPKDKAAQAKDLANKRKYREMLLAKVRSYQSLIQGSPLNQKLFFQANPWRNEKGTVNALDLMRAINDINLNVERGVE